MTTPRPDIAALAREFDRRLRNAMQRAAEKNTRGRVYVTDDDAHSLLFEMAREGLTVTLAPAASEPGDAADLWTRLANDIRAVDGNHDLGAGELAHRLVERGWTLAPAASEFDVERAVVRRVYARAERMGVRLGQVWADNDARSRKRGERQHLAVVSLDNEKVGLFNAETGRTSTVKLARMRPSSTGYRLVSDRPDPPT